MRLGTVAAPSGDAWRAVAFTSDDTVLDLAAAATLLGESSAIFDAGAANGSWLGDEGRALARKITGMPKATLVPALHPLAALRIGPPVPQPRTFIATGRNYGDHLREGQRIWAERGKKVEKAEHPTAFIKLASAIVPHGAAIRIPRNVDCVDYEIELVAVIGRRAFEVPLEHALDYVAGYTICNDVGARRIQRFEMEHQIGLSLSKNFPSFAPLGPWMTTSDEIPDPQTLDVHMTVNGETRQQANTSDMIFAVADLVAYWSRIGLEPGDMISTGTPSGVALARPNPEQFYLKPGDVAEATISGIGSLRNPVAAA
jgi:2-keto-4-pentenoate hydratase/2-oxohepta-3-ene-1,7-dioic acid hydratase in catechol pathway